MLVPHKIAASAATWRDDLLPDDQITAASPTSWQGSPSTSASNCGQLSVSVPLIFFRQVNLPLFNRLADHPRVGEEVDMVRACRAEHQHNSGQSSLGAGTHVPRLHRHPRWTRRGSQRKISRSQAALAAAAA